MLPFKNSCDQRLAPPSTAWRGAVWTALAGLLMATAGCGSDDAVRGAPPLPVPADLECFDGSLSGAGSSAQENAMTTWIAGYQTNCDDAQVYYDSIGSGGGRSQFIDGAVAFAGSDAAMKPEENADAQERCSGSDTVNLPAYVVAIAVVFNLEGIDSLNLTPEAIAGIFNQQITRWDDEAIAEANPGLDLPDMAITPVTRSDDSGTTQNFTAYLAATGGEAWPHEPSGQWPITPAEAAQGNSGIADTVESAPGTVGYVEVSHVHGMSTASVGVGEDFVEISPEAAARVVADSPRRADNPSEYDLAIDLDFGTTAADTYPIVLVTYQVACLEYEDAAQAERLRSFLRYVVSPEGQEAASEETGSAPISDEMREQLHTSIDAIGGTP